jgi:SAM-dependent methyltransferase
VEIKSLLDLCQQEIIACPNRCPYIFAGAYQEYDFYAQYELLYWLDILNWLPELPSIPRNCLDIGCNYGTLLLIMKHLYPEISLYGIDLSALVPQELVGKYSINFYLGDIELESIPWQDKFDVIIFTAVLEHLEFHPLATLTKSVSFCSQLRYLSPTYCAL